MIDESFTSGTVIVNFHSQVDWDDYHDFLSESDKAISRIHSIGIIAKGDLFDKLEWRAEILRLIGVDTKLFRTVAELELWAESKLPGQTLEELA
jgi:hypothetical protein